MLNRRQLMMRSLMTTFGVMPLSMGGLTFEQLAVVYGRLNDSPNADASESTESTSPSCSSYASSGMSIEACWAHARQLDEELRQRQMARRERRLARKRKRGA
jgi:hypothetical protein